ncbi:hypothetical protein ANCCAN_03987 [Ancylostoma caninum]|uniref:Uncharacterized protein n=1 Tax=Ancylostoma caninum TaxID=29170 RepID=A0A368H010_ANCCA|nr:hypothetical protein ANCCAN_03987 [Ancylostoma caninum]
MQARKIRYDVSGLTETRRHRPLNATFDTGEELFFGTCDSRGVGGVGVLVNANLNNGNRHLAIEARSLCYTRRYIQLNLKIIWWRKTCRR